MRMMIVQRRHHHHEIAERVCLGGICAPKFYKVDLINKTDCQTHEFCQVINYCDDNDGAHNNDDDLDD